MQREEAVGVSFYNAGAEVVPELCAEDGVSCNGIPPVIRVRRICVG